MQPCQVGIWIPNINSWQLSAHQHSPKHRGAACVPSANSTPPQVDFDSSPLCHATDRCKPAIIEAGEEMQQPPPRGRLPGRHLQTTQDDNQSAPPPPSTPTPSPAGIQRAIGQLLTYSQQSTYRINNFNL